MGTVDIERKRQMIKKMQEERKSVRDNTKVPSLGVEGIPSAEVGRVNSNS